MGMLQAKGNKVYKLFRVFIFLSLLGGSIACSNRSWKKLSSDKVREILPELTLLKAYLNTHNVPDSVRYVTYYAFFHKYGVSQTDWDSTMFWYAKNDINLYHNFYSRLDDSIRRLQIKLQKKVDALDEAERRQYRWEEGILEDSNLLLDTVYPKYMIPPVVINESFIYQPRIRYDSTERVSMNFAIDGMSFLAQDSLFMTFSLFQEGKLDTTVQQVIRDNGAYSLSLVARKGKIDSISASVRGCISRSNGLGFISIDSLALIRIGEKKEEFKSY